MTASTFDLQSAISKFLNGTSETVEFCFDVIKINKRNKQQKRKLVLTNKAIYNIKPKNNQIQRRIDLLDIASITTSLISSEFTLNIPSQYDYRYKVETISSQNEIISIICHLTKSLNHEILINKINNLTTKKWTVTGNVLKHINSHYDKTVRFVMALDHLTNIGFKRNKARCALIKNNGNLSFAMQSLISQSSIIKESCNSKPTTPTILSSSPSLEVSLIQSITDEVDDGFTIRMKQ